MSGVTFVSFAVDTDRGAVLATYSKSGHEGHTLINIKVLSAVFSQMVLILTAFETNKYVVYLSNSYYVGATQR